MMLLLRLPAWIILSCLSCLWAMGQSATVTLSGTVTSPTEDVVSLYYQVSPVQQTPTVIEAELDRKGQFTLSVSLEEPVMATLAYGGGYDRLFLIPGDELSITLDSQTPEQLLRLEGSGPGAAASRFLQEWSQAHESIEAQKEAMTPLQEAESLPAAYEQLLNQHAALQEEWISTQEEASLPASFREYFSHYLTYSQANQLIESKRYFLLFHQDIELPEVVTQYPVEHEEIMRRVKLNQPDALSLPQYFLFLEHQMNTRLDADSKSEEDVTIDQKMAFVSTLDREIQAPMTAYLIGKALDYGNPTTVEEAYYQLAEMEGGEKYIEILEPVFEKAMRLAPGRMAPNFRLKDSEGKQVELSDLAGKLVYIDFWASWCGPCLAEMPYTRQLIAEHSEVEDIVFVFISIDDDEDAWRQAMEKEAIPGIHLLSQGFGSEVAQLYNVNGIPRYFVIDKAGRILDPFPPRPSSGELTALFEAYLSVE